MNRKLFNLKKKRRYLRLIANNAKAISMTTITTTKPMIITISIDNPPTDTVGVGVAPTGVGSVLPTGVKTAW